ncbi:type II toxin-antitoxin system RelE/ParE family toxin [Dyadobacter chenwenxiniae]|uniref:Type II toxin-antitoxin system RelE/ParE family toxin n=1 Tax=Dyadobacter chenwenxiniae TaxID=2906456 RepID=A0A9X1PJT0_9BACT|nr:type II toxin-antitoxin system RelE/ParE family toxin [Dyadobacter chenwenxiniae]MCF0062737.1 type II toxin-antitoxin system RelE/ParE family toxin [Dyadobacter chenwenxiniae]UON85086.1 type II toxin-antitoxin system RelE/ParE family toxin [Dyadobacter chenwenxiniae]
MVEITYTHEFLREYKRLAKKYSSLETEVKSLIEILSANPTRGTPLGSQIFKIRWQVKSKRKGKSGGIRVITYFKILNNELFLLDIYDKSERETVSLKDIRSFIELLK